MQLRWANPDTFNFICSWIFLKKGGGEEKLSWGAVTYTLLQVFDLATAATDIHDPPPSHPRIKLDSNLDSKLRLKGSPCNFPPKLEQSQQLVIHMHLKSNTLLLCPSVAPPSLTHQWASAPPTHPDHYTPVTPPPHFFLLTLPVALPRLFLPFACYPGYTARVPPPSQLDSTQGLIW